MALPIDIFPAVMSALTLISQGRTKTSACDEADISTAAFDTYVQSQPELHAAFNAAEERGYDTMAELLLELDNHPVYGTRDAKLLKITSDNIKWFLSRRRPQKYGERVIVENKITADKAITDALNRGKQRALMGTVIEDVAYEVVQEAIDVSVLPDELRELV
jgi:hypothetical protein